MNGNPLKIVRQFLTNAVEILSNKR